MTSRTLPRSVEGFGITLPRSGLSRKTGRRLSEWRCSGSDRGRRDGLLVEEGDVVALAKVFQQLMTDAGLRQKIRRGWTQARREFQLGRDRTYCLWKPCQNKGLDILRFLIL